MGGSPEDPNLAVGSSQVVQQINNQIAVFTKPGTVQYANNTMALWTGFGGACENPTEQTDGIVRADNLATGGRWVISQIAEDSASNYYECVAVSTGGDATGTYNLYSIGFGTSLPDYPKLAVWPDAYYLTVNEYANGENGSYLGAVTCALNRTAMLTGGSPAAQCFNIGSSEYSVLAADDDATTGPPAGQAETLMGLGTNALNYWTFHVDFANPANTTISSQPSILPVAAFANCGSCVPQPATTTSLDSRNWLMFRLAYRNIGGTQSLVVTHAVQVGSGVTGERWYELHLATNGSISVYQQSTYAPDSTSRWMGSAAMDAAGDIALGYSASSSTVYPSIRFTGRLSTDPLNQMTQGEGNILSGFSGQPTSWRWGDYSAMDVDPVDGCTFWYTAQYDNTPSVQYYYLSSRLASFQLPGCDIRNPGFEVSGLSSWSTAGTTSVTTSDVHSGGSAAMVGSTSATDGDSWVQQSFTVPYGATTLSFWYDNHCPDLVNYDWAKATLTDLTTGNATTPLAATCTNDNTWHQVSATVTPGHTVQLQLLNHDDNFPGDPTYTVYDDIGFNTSPAPDIINGGFETNGISGWYSNGSTTATSADSHSGTHAAAVGTTVGTPNGGAVIAQYFSPTAGHSTLSFWYKVHCTGNVGTDWADVGMDKGMVGSGTPPTTTTLLNNTCTNDNTWHQITAPVTSGQFYDLYFKTHQGDNSATYLEVDDVTVS